MEKIKRYGHQQISILKKVINLIINLFSINYQFIILHNTL